MNIPLYKTIGQEEINAVMKVMLKGQLSGFLGAWNDEFYGGEEVRNLERNWCRYFNTKNSISMNSATSCLYASLGAIDIKPKDEVIVTPTSMTASVTGILVYGGVPKFADIDEDSFCINTNNIKKMITNKTKAIIGVNIYGNSADWDEIMRIADEYNLMVIEDAAQSIGGKYKGKYSGTLGHIGVHSLNKHKHIHCGEGGICLTNNDELAERLQLIRNHGEAVVEDKKIENYDNLLGYNFRMTEIEATIANEQLKKLSYFVNKRRDVSHKLISIFKDIKGIEIPYEDKSIVHTFYYTCFKLNKKLFGRTRQEFIKRMNENGFPLKEGGYLPIYLQPIYKSKGYSKGLCPIAERMWFDELFYFPSPTYMPTDDNIENFKLILRKSI